MTKFSKVLTMLLICLLLPTCALAQPASEAAIAPEVEAMLPALDSVLLAMDSSEQAYAPRDPEFFWKALYLMAVNWDAYHPLAQYNEDKSELILPRIAVQELATAMFADYDDLLAVPESMAASVQYDQALDAYRFPMSDVGDVSPVIDEVAEAEGGLVVHVSLKGYPEEKEETLYRVRFELVPNAYAGAVAEPTYLYSITSATPEA